MRYLKVIGAALFVIIVVVFILQNNDLHRSVHLSFGWDIFKTGLDSPAPAPPIPADSTASADSAKAVDSAAKAAPAVRPGVNVPVFILVFLAFFVGLVLASLFSLAEKYRLKRVVQAGGGRIRELEEEIKSLRNMPLTGSAEGKPIIKPTPANSDMKPDRKNTGDSALPTGLTKTKGLTQNNSPAQPEPKPASAPVVNNKLSPIGAPDNKSHPAKSAIPLPGPVGAKAPGNGIASQPLKVNGSSPVAAPVPAKAPEGSKDRPDSVDSKPQPAPQSDDKSAKAPESEAKKSGLFSRLTGSGKKKTEADKKDG